MEKRRPLYARSAHVTDAGCDWITCTGTADLDTGQLLDLAELIQDHQHDRGFVPAPWRWNGYLGYHGEGYQWGRRPDGTILRLSGEVAQIWWGLAFRRCNNVTRLDLQVTVEGVEPGIDVALIARTQVDERSRMVGRPFRWSHVQTNAHGSTLYLGSRASERFYRLYDKGAEEIGQHLSGQWRYECEFKQSTAVAACQVMSAMADPPLGMLNAVHEEFSVRGVKPLFERDSEPPEITPQIPLASDERTIAWLESHVRGPINKLRLHDREATVYRALNLPALGEPPSAPGGRVG